MCNIQIRTVDIVIEIEKIDKYEETLCATLCP